MSVALKELQVPADLKERYGRPDAWHGDTHDPSGKPLEAAKDKPRIVRAVWFPAAAQGDDLVEELHIIYDDGEVIKIPAEEFRRDK